MAIRASSFFDAGDWTVITVYLVGIIGLGLWFGRGQKTTRDYFLGSKNVPWWGVGLSIIAAETSAVTIISVPALAYGTDLSLIQIILGYVIARIILAVVMVPHYFKGEIYSPYQLFGNAFGPAARRTAGGFFLIAEVLAAGVRVYVACIPIQLMLGIKELPAILLFVGFSLVYTYIGGIKAVIWTDAAQFVLFMLGGLFTVVYVPQLFDGGLTEAFSRAAAGGKLHWLNTKFTLGMPFNLWMGLIGGTVQVMASHGASQLIVQRVLTCRSIADGRKALTLSAVIILPLFLTFLLAGVMLWVYYQQLPMAIPIPATRAGIQRNDFIFPIFIMTAVPNILKGCLIVAILSAAMSSISSALSSLASVSTMDLFQSEGKTRSAAADLKFSKYSTVFWAFMLVIVAYLSREAEFILNIAFNLMGLTNGAMLGGLILAIWKPFRNALPLICGMFTSLLVMVLIQMLPSARPDLWQRMIGPPIAWPWFTLIGTLITIGTALAVAKLTERGRAE